MKLSNITEIASVSNIGAARDKRDMERQQAKRDATDQMFVQIDHVVAATIDSLVNQQGMDQTAAEDMVYDHLGELAMGHDGMKHGW